MNSEQIRLLTEVLEAGVGAEVVVESDNSGLRTGLKCWFSGLTPNQGPVFSIVPTGLKRHRVSVGFGSFSGPCIDQMHRADAERLALARAFVQQLSLENEVTLRPEQRLEEWKISKADFGIDVLVRNVADPNSDKAIGHTARTVMVPLVAAMAELIGYDEIVPVEFDVEGQITRALVTRRERSPRNRLLCLSIHGNRCQVCGFEPSSYGIAEGIVEVHHLEPVSNLTHPRPYDPRCDLVPLCPNCHRAVHTSRPIPITPEALREMIRNVVR